MTHRYPFYPTVDATKLRERQDALRKGQTFWGKVDSDLSDDIIMDITSKEGEYLYSIVRNWPYNEPPPIIIAVDRIKTIGFVRGTVGGSDWLTDAAKKMGNRTKGWNGYVNKIREFLRLNSNIVHLIGHSLGLALAYDAVVNSHGEFDNVKIVGMNGANILLNDTADLPFVRNINADSTFDAALDPWGPIETTPSYEHNKNTLQRVLSVGHNSYRYKYHPYFAHEIKRLQLLGHKNIRTGYFDGKVRSTPPRSNRIGISGAGKFTKACLYPWGVL